ncbi:MAG: hypothetical protein AAF821_20740 [Cyanobacteria bacterium P01_D01_bin.156]
MVTNTRAAAQQSQPCSFLVSPQHLNTAEGSNVTSIGQLDNRPYIVLITTDLEARLPIVQTCIPDSFVTSSRLGSYIRVASLDNYWDAKALADHMSDVLDMQVRVIHENRLRP